MKIKKSRVKTLPLTVLAIIVLAAVAIAAVYAGSSRIRTKSGLASSSAYVLERVGRGSLESLVSSTGTIEPVSKVSVLAQMNGRAEKVYADYNDRVEKGEVLVALDTGTLELERREAAAAVDKAKASRDLAAVDRDNKEALAVKGLIADYDLASSKTSLAVAEADLEQAKAALDVIDTELGSYALVRSPISGVVLERDVDVGQSVVAGGSTGSSSLFTLAGDLSKVEIEASVDELDIASIRAGQVVRFAVEAIPGASYTGTVKQIRLVPTTSDNVVSYTVIVDAANPDGKLLPGMTATVDFVKQSRKDVLTVPNAALRFSPPGLNEAERARRLFVAGLAGMDEGQKAAALASYDKNAAATAATAATAASRASATKAGSSTGGLGSVMMPTGPGGPGGPGGFGGPGARAGLGAASGKGATGAQTELGASSVPAETKALWYLDDKGEFQAILVRIGVSDGLKTEVSGPPDLEGREIVVKEKI
ncbi:MAG TPA: efflux RND transporter periplasmic adaptor subunit [Rectinemataceae bacterium]|nr:efflux RND transporter periplasmic adaptor subunit [Rectinemataceae bacterium]